MFPTGLEENRGRTDAADTG